MKSEAVGGSPKMGGPVGGPWVFLAFYTLLCLNLPKRHLTHIQAMFYQTFRYFVKQKHPLYILKCSHYIRSIFRILSCSFGVLYIKNSEKPSSVPCGTPLGVLPIIFSMLVNGASVFVSCVLIMLNSRLFWRCSLMFLAVSRYPAAIALNARSPGEVRFGVIAPIDDVANEQTLPQILPPVKLAVRAVTDPVSGILPGWKIHLIHRNSNCSSIIGPLAAVELHKDLGKFEHVSLLGF